MTTPVNGRQGPQENTLSTNKAHTSKVGGSMLERIGLASKLEGRFDLSSHRVTLGRQNHTSDIARSFFNEMV